MGAQPGDCGGARRLLRRLLIGAMCCASVALTACSSHRDAAPTEQADFAPSPSIRAPWQDATPRPDPLLAEGNRSPYEVNGARYAVRVSAQGYRERGVASWYGMKFQGRPTANGEIFDVYGATAAHRSLPIPTYVRVTNLGNDRTVVLRVNDRGPFHSDRLIDLSYGRLCSLASPNRALRPYWWNRLIWRGSMTVVNSRLPPTVTCNWARIPPRLPRASSAARSAVHGLTPSLSAP